MSGSQREKLIEERGQPQLRLEFDVFDADRVSMWTHLDHNADYATIRALFIAASDHLTEFIRDGAMCPFAPDPPLK